jgi:hypothetical protein
MVIDPMAIDPTELSQFRTDGVRWQLTGEEGERQIDGDQQHAHHHDAECVRRVQRAQLPTEEGKSKTRAAAQQWTEHSSELGNQTMLERTFKTENDEDNTPAGSCAR